MAIRTAQPHPGSFSLFCVLGNRWSLFDVENTAKDALEGWWRIEQRVSFCIEAQSRRAGRISERRVGTLQGRFMKGSLADAVRETENQD